MSHQEIPCTYEPQASYAHLSPVDVALWERFMFAHPGRFDRVWYDFRVGDEDEIPEDEPYRTKQCWWDLTYWRIDVVAEDVNTIYVIEVKPAANAKAIGQALAYATLYEEDEKPGKKVVAVVLTDQIIPTTQRVAKRHGVEMWVA